MIHGGRLRCNRNACCIRQVLTLRAAQFPDALFVDKPSVTTAAYADDPLFKLHGSRKGRVMQNIIQKTLVESSPHLQFSEADPGSRVDGRRRGRHQAEFDFMCGRRRIECKGASMAWIPTRRSWNVSWVRIKFNQDYFDDLVLAFHSPGQVDIVLHDGTTGVCSMGLKTEILGHSIQFVSGIGVDDPAAARRNILAKMLQTTQFCQHIATLPSGSISELVAAELGSDSPNLSWYAGVPLSDLSACARALRLEEVAFTLDQLLHPSSNFSRDAGSAEVVGSVRLQRRGIYRASADWLRDDIKVEFKSSRLSWVRCLRTWRCHFRGIKFAYVRPERPPMPAPFDELLLGVYSPRGLHVFQYGGNVGRCKAGVQTDLDGHSIQLRGPSGQDCPDTCLDEILGKLEGSGCKPLATVAW